MSIGGCGQPRPDVLNSRGAEGSVAAVQTGRPDPWGEAADFNPFQHQHPFGCTSADAPLRYSTMCSTNNWALR